MSSLLSERVSEGLDTLPVVDSSNALGPVEIEWLATPRGFRQPLVLVALHGLFDAGKAATNAAVWIREHSDAQLIGRFDPEELYDFSESRPFTAFADDGTRYIEWPTVKIYGCRTGGPRDVIVAVGIEPQFRWAAVADQIASIVRLTGASMVVTLGSTLAMTPHTRPARVVGSSGDVALVTRMQLKRPTYEGPTGVVGVLNQMLEAGGIPVLSLRAEVPHYVPGSPSPKATQALLRRFEHLSQIPTRYEDLDGWVAEWLRQVDAAVNADEESRVYLSQLEARVDQDEKRLPSGDDVAGELEAYLRELDGGPED